MNYLSTHPTSDKRIENLNNMLSEITIDFEAVDFPYVDLKEKISKIEN